MSNRRALLVIGLVCGLGLAAFWCLIGAVWLYAAFPH
jgi:hypothetical protein